MPSETPIALRTIYAELLDRAASADFADAFREDGTFVVKAIRGRRYWYFQEPAEVGRRQQYVGPETPALLERITRHKEAGASLDNPIYDCYPLPIVDIICQLCK